MGEPIVMNMSVRLDSDFQDNLKDSSSLLYQKYKVDLEKAVMTLVFLSLKVESPLNKVVFTPSAWCLSQVPGWSVSLWRRGKGAAVGVAEWGKSDCVDGNENIPIYFNTLGSI